MSIIRQSIANQECMRPAITRLKRQIILSEGTNKLG